MIARTWSLKLINLLVAIREKSDEFHSRANTFPQQAYNYVATIQEFSDSECSSINGD
jgi:hypothetical protein